MPSFKNYQLTARKIDIFDALKFEGILISFRKLILSSVSLTALEGFPAVALWLF